MPGTIRPRWLSYGLDCILAVSFLLNATQCFAANAPIRFDIPEGPLADMLDTFGRQADVDILYFDSSIVKGLRAPALQAELTADEALTRLLAGKPLHAEKTGDRTVKIMTDTAATPAHTVTRPAAKKPPQKSNLEEVVVTGGYIWDVRSLLPLITVTHQQLVDRGYVHLGQFFAQLTQNFAGISSTSNPIVGNARGAGTNQTFAVGVDLRGLGPGTTLVLLNGHRLPSSVIGQSVDISAIPMSAIDHIDIMADGASATYGSDAIGGVVNIITIDHFTGFELAARSDEISQGKKGDPAATVLAGIPWMGGGAGLLTLDFEQHNPLYSDQRSFTAGALNPTNLLPTQQILGGYLSARQDLGNDFVVRTEVFASERRFRAYDASFGSLNLTDLDGRADQLDAVLQLDYRISQSWRFNLAAQFASENDVVVTTYPSAGAIDTDHFTNQATSLESYVKGPIARIAGEEVQLALGAAFRKEQFDWTPSYAPPIATQRNIASIFGELLVPLVADNSQCPLIQTLTVDLSGRYDGYTDFGSAWTPKIAALLKMSDSLSWHASYSRSFRSPTLYELHATPFAALVAAPDPSGSNGTLNTLVVDGGNTRLTPERSRSVEFGVTYQPEAMEGLKLDVSASNIVYTKRIDQLSQDGFTTTNVIADATVLGQLVNQHPTAAQVEQELNTPGLIRYTPIDVNDIAAIAQVGFENVGSIRVQAMDTTLHYSHQFDGGLLTAELASSYFAHYIVRITPQSAPTSFVGTAYGPTRSRSRLDLGWTQNAWTANGRLNFVGSYHDGNDPTCPAAPGCPVSTWLTFDAAVTYSSPASDASPFHGVRIAVSLSNLFDRAPPYVYGGGSGLNYDPANAAAMGRALAITVTKRWGDG